MPRSARFTIEVAKGFEYEVNKSTVEVKAGENQTVTVRLKRMVDFLAKGWRSGSNHVHMNYAGNLHNTPENMLLMARAEDMGMTSLQIANKDNRVLDVQAYTPGQSLHPLSKDDYVMHVGQEYRPPFYGHISLFNLTEHLISPFVTGYEGTGIESLYPSNTDIFRYAKQQGGIGAYVHPYYADGDPLETNLGTAKGFPVDVALESLSYHELWSQSAGDGPLMVWYHALNNGFRVPVTGGEDSISSLHRVELVGVSRGYFQIGDSAVHMAVVDEGAARRPRLRDQRAAAGVQRQRRRHGRRGHAAGRRRQGDLQRHPQLDRAGRALRAGRQRSRWCTPSRSPATSAGPASSCRSRSRPAAGTRCARSARRSPSRPRTPSRWP